MYITKLDELELEEVKENDIEVSEHEFMELCYEISEEQGINNRYFIPDFTEYVQ